MRGRQSERASVMRENERKRSDYGVGEGIFVIVRGRLCRVGS